MQHDYCNEMRRPDSSNLPCLSTFHLEFPLELSRFCINMIKLNRKKAKISKIEKVPRGYQGEKLSKDTASSGKLVSIMWAYANPKEGMKQVSEKLSSPCWHPKPVENAPRKPFLIRWRSSAVPSLSWCRVGKTGLNNQSICMPPNRWRNQVSGDKRSLLACHTHCKLSMETTWNWVKVKLGIKVMKLVENLIGWEVNVSGQGSKCLLTLVKGRLYIVE